MARNGGRVTYLAAAVARAYLYSLIDHAPESGESIGMGVARNRAVLLSKRAWKSIEETLYLQSTPGMRESIRKGLKTPPGECATSPGW